MVESSPSCQRRPRYETTKGKSDEAAAAAAHTYLLTCMGSNHNLPVYTFLFEFLLNFSNS